VTWTILWIAGNSIGELLAPLLNRCCAGFVSRHSATVQQAHTLTWKQAMPHIESTNPPASYRLDRSRDFESLGVYLNHAKEQEKAPPSEDRPPEHGATGSEAAASRVVAYR